MKGSLLAIAVLATIVLATAKPQSRSGECCEGGYNSGDVAPHPTDCDKYRVCCDGVMKVESCGEGQLFNTTSKQCVEDIHNVCNPVDGNCVEGTLEPYPTNCSMYLRCCSGTFKEQFCGVDYYFNVIEKNCLKDINNVCWPKETPICEEGQVTANTMNCSYYNECVNGSWETQKCGYGNYFDENEKTCIKDINNVCWPKVTPLCEEGQVTANTVNCSYYNSCVNGSWETEMCGYGNYFDENEKTCIKDINNVCWPKVTPVCEEGQVTANTVNCSYYNECVSGSWETQMCGYGNYFDENEKTCTKDINNVCWPKVTPVCEEGQVTANTVNCSYYNSCVNGSWETQMCGYGNYFDENEKTCIKDINNVCWPKVTPVCEQGQIATNPVNCSYYYTCINGSWETEKCGYGNYYNPATKDCVEDTQNICWPKTTCEGGIGEGQVVAGANCSTYSVCYSGELIPKTCNKGYMFDSNTRTCLVDTNNVCWPKITCEGGVEEGQNVPGANCSSYSVCSNGQMVTKFCGKGYMFDSKTQKCLVDSNNVCWPKVTCEGGVEEGQNVPGANCSSYSLCSNGDLVTKFCNEGYMFDSKTQKCVVDSNNVCWSKPTCEGGVEEGQNVPGANCSSYSLCSNGDLLTKFCNEGYMFDSKTQKCVVDSNNVCWLKATCEGGVEEGQTVSGSNCSSYSVCSNGELVTKFCNEGYMFDLKTQGCLVDSSNVCWPKTTCEGGVEEGQTVSGSNCSSYSLCSNGTLVTKFCNEGYMFDSKTQKCVVDSNNMCWPKTTCDGGVEDGQSVAGSNCSSYSLCCHGDLVTIYCKEGYMFDSKTQKCVADSNNLCWPKITCEGGVQEGESVSGSNCSSYSVCSNGELVTKFCNEGYMFDSKTQGCVVDSSNVCWPKTTCEGGVEEGQTVSGSNCSSYSVCSNGELVTKFCNEGYMFDLKTQGCLVDSSNVCWPKTTCEGGVEEGQIVSGANCSSYSLCFNGTLVTKFCEEGYMFDSKTQKCVVDSNNMCWPKTTCDGGVEDGQSVAGSNCSSYSLCCHGDLVTIYCKEGYMFDSTTQKCVADSNNVCWPKITCEGGVQEGESVSGSNCSSYSVCSNGELVTKFCNEGYMFDSKTQGCLVDSSNVCWPKTTCEGGVEEGQTVSGSNCSSYSLCSNGTLVTKFCNEGYMFDSKTQKCVVDSNNMCWPKTTCDGGVEDGQSVAGSNCSSYSLCCHGDLVTIYCKEGYMFDSKTQKCVADSNNLCWPKITCEGGVQEGESVSGSNCSSYSVCSNGELVTKFCNEGYMFDSKTQGCVVDSSNVCWPKTTCEGGVEEGQTVSGSNCSSYSVCSNGELVTKFCNEGYMFDLKTQGCLVDSSNVCWPKTTCEGGVEEGQIVSGANCSSYSLCFNGTLVTKFCEEGYMFDSKTQKCVVDSNNMCWPKITCEGGVQEGESVPGANCSSYSVCSNGELVPNFCIEGYMFDSKTQKCVVDSNNVCWLKATCEGGVEEGQNVPGANCSSYSLCSNGDLVTKFCNEGYMFDSKTQKCVVDSNNVCWSKPTCEGGVEEGQNVPGANCSSYSLCSNGDLVTKFCNEGYMFDSKTKGCVVDSNNVCWSKPTCEGGVEEGQTVSGSNCSSYSICSNGDLVTKFCNEGYMFDLKTQKCVVDSNNVCWSKPTCEGGVEEGQNVPGANCSSYSLCCNGDLVTKFCNEGYMFDSKSQGCVVDSNNVCWLKATCEGGVEEGQNVPGANCSSYSLCSNGDLVTKFCNEGYMFDSKTQKCVVDSNNVCWSKPTCEGGVEEGQNVPGANCSSYSLCSNGDLVTKFCNEGYMFDSKTQGCVVDSNNVCWSKPTCEGGVEEGQTVSGSNCSSYSICSNGDLVTKFCNEGYMFDLKTQKCVVDSNNVCWTKTTCEGGIEDGQSVAGSNCSSYSLCCHGDLVTIFCNEGYIFDLNAQKCVVDANNVCWSKPSCEGGLKDGQSVAGPNCSTYSVCCNGELRTEVCSDGFMFDLNAQKCVADADNVCWPKSNC